MDDSKNQLVNKLKESNNVLVTVSRNPSLDQLSSLLGLTLALNKAGKHAAAVFSGQVPSALEFLQPDDTIEKNTDSLRDFIISLDKSKADKLRYKVEDDVVRIFITPYKTSISQSDLEFSEGDFNVDLVVAIGVKEQEDVDQAITSHGRILHDATVSSINVSNQAGLGSIVWIDEHASSLSELVTELIQALDESLIDGQIATSLLTGIVSETDRFSNDKTSSHTMSASAALMAAGANQQLVATQLAQKPTLTSNDDRVNLQDSESGNDGVLEIEHNPEEEAAAPAPEVPAAPEPAQSEETTKLTPGAKLIVDPPTLGGQLTANSNPEALEPSIDPLGEQAHDPGQIVEKPAVSTEGKTLADIEKDVDSPHLQEGPTITPAAGDSNPVAPSVPINPAGKTLADIEKDVDSPHLQEVNVPDAQEAVSKAINSDDTNAELTPSPIKALNSQVLGQELHPPSNQPTDTNPVDVPSNEVQGFNANIAPPVPPPLPFDYSKPDNQ